MTLRRAVLIAAVVCVASAPASRREWAFPQTGLASRTCSWEAAVVDSTSFLQTRVDLSPRDVPVQVQADAVDNEAAEASGVTSNGRGDLAAFLAGLATYGFGCSVLVISFCVLRRWYPLMFANNILEGFAPKPAPDDSFFGWFTTVWNTSIDDVAESVGLDMAMQLKFTELCMKILAIISVPMVLVLGPTHFVFGGQAAVKIGDRLSYFSMGNVEVGSHLYWIHALVVWGVVLVVQVNVYAAQKEFLRHRYKWLREMPAPRSTTVLVECIPEEYRSDAQLKHFFEQQFGAGKVKSAHVVKQTSELAAAVKRRDAVSRDLLEDMAILKKQEASSGEQPKSELVDGIEASEKEMHTLREEVTKLRAEVEEAALQVGGVNLKSGFVTFFDRHETEVALNLLYSHDDNEWSVSRPPPLTSITWSDLQVDPQRAAVRSVIGYALVAGLYAVYLPSVIWITNIATRINMGAFQPLWLSVAPTMGLQFMVAFLPTFLISIFDNCFVLKDEAWAQQRLQNWYFVFNVVFVVLVTAVGSNALQFAQKAVTDPFGLAELFGSTLPQATHFYMNYLVLQWLSHCMNLTRFFPLFKFKVFCLIFTEADARAMSEPEDQDYYGIGSRSARFTTNMIIGIIFSTLCPWMAPLAFINFFICRIVYGYLTPFAETKKPDLGGVFWVHQLKHLFVGNLIYCIMMTGVLSGRSPTHGPPAVAGLSTLYVVWSMLRFENAFSWERLPYPELTGEALSEPSYKYEYVQPEMVEGAPDSTPSSILEIARKAWKRQ